MIPMHERRILEAHVRGVSLRDLAVSERPLNEYEERELRNLIKMRVQGLPLQYLTGSQAFYGREFYVNTGVLIPRPETEGLVELVLGRLPPPDFQRSLRALEFGVGSGCIALTLALERPDLVVAASEASADAYSVACENARLFRVMNSNLFQVSEEPQLWQYEDLGQFDFLISNPPYLVPGDEVAEDVRRHEPREALFTPEGDPMYYYRFLAELLDARVGPGGFGAFEIAEDRGEETAAVFTSRGYRAEVRKDLAGRDRYLIVDRAGSGQ